MKNFVKAMNKHGTDFECLGEKFSKLSDATLKDGILLDRKFLKSLMMIHLNTC
jgi:arsenate reductase-like glutaredoxin family protein